jgi:hypothetical protein
MSTATRQTAECFLSLSLSILPVKPPDCDFFLRIISGTDSGKMCAGRLSKQLRLRAPVIGSSKVPGAFSDKPATFGLAYLAAAAAVHFASACSAARSAARSLVIIMLHFFW